MKNKKRKYFVAFRNFVFWYKMTKEEAEKHGLKDGMNEGTEELINLLNEKYYEGNK